MPRGNDSRVAGIAEMAKRVLALAAMLAAACGGPATPSPIVISVAIVGVPARINLGDVVTLQAMANLSTGTFAPVLHPTWSSSNTKVLRVSADGVVEAFGEGPATITVTAGQRSANAPMWVNALPSVDRYTLRGVVRGGAPNADAPLVNASVTIAGSWDAGVTTVTDATGAFVFTDLSAPFGNGFPVRVSRAGYRDGSFTVVRLPRDGQADVALEPVAGCAYAVTPAALWSGEYVFSGSFHVTTSPGCAWTASLIDGVAEPGFFRFTGSTTGTGSGVVTYGAFSTYGSLPYVYTIRIEGPNGGSAIYVVRVNSR